MVFITLPISLLWNIQVFGDCDGVVLCCLLGTVLFYYEEGLVLYFGNKFDKEFYYLCVCQKKGLEGSFKLLDSMWWEFRKHSSDRFKYKNDKHNSKKQPTYIHALPLVLTNKLSSSNSDDKNIEDKMLLCKYDSSTRLRCEWVKKRLMANEDDGYICDFGITTITGDLVGKK